MDKLNTYIPLVARLLIAALFLMAGIGKLSNVEGFAGYLASGGIPAILAWPAILFELAVAASLILGFQVRVMALLGAGFCVVTALLYHFQPADQMQMTSFLKNLAIAGGFLMLFSSGAGAVALDKR
jgi:putative oxidoreductase